MSVPEPIQFRKLIDALLDESRPFSPRYLNRLSDLDPVDAALLAESWNKVTLRRRESLLEDLEELHMADDVLCFEAVGRLALKDPEPGLRAKAIRILSEYELVDLLSAFVDLSEHDPDEKVRASAAAALATYVYMGEVEDISLAKLTQVEDCLLRIINGSDAIQVRRRALEAIGFSSRKEVTGLIEKAYRSDDFNWLVSALFAMGRSANPRWNAQVLKMLDHKRPTVRAEAASAAGELEIKAATRKLLEMLDDDDMDVRMATIWALSQLGGEGVRQALESLLESTDDDEEADQIENALDNLDFTEEMKELDLLDLQDVGDQASGSSDDDYDSDINELISEDDED